MLWLTCWNRFDMASAFRSAGLKSTPQRLAMLRYLSDQPVHAIFDVNFHPHHHFLCEGCGAVEDIGWFDLPAAARGALGARRLRHFDIVFRGLCVACLDADKVQGD